MDDSSHNVTVNEANSVLESWRSFDLPIRKAALDNSCVDMREAKTASIAGRKRLNELTKAFRAKPKEEQLIMMAEVLKAYQEEIDQLSRRSKYCETTFFSFYKALYEIPDPCEAIEQLIVSVTTGSSNQLEIERLRGELRQYDEEFQQLKNQDITIRRLEDQLQEFRDQNEEKIQEEVSRRAADVEERAEARVAEVLEIQRTVERRHAAAVDAMQIAQQSADRAQTQLYEVSAQAENRVSALQSENAVLAEGAQRQSLRLAEAESELEHAKKALADLQQQVKLHGLAGGSGGTKDGSEGSGVIHGEDAQTLQIVVSRLRDELGNQEDLLRSEKHRLDSQIRDLAAQLAAEKDVVVGLRQELSERPTREQYHAVRRQLRMVQKIAFNVQDEDAEDEDGLGEPETAGADAGDLPAQLQLEALLASRMKALESDLTAARRELAQSREQEAGLKESAATLKESLTSSTQLISRLEKELESRSAALEEAVAVAAGIAPVSSAAVGLRGGTAGRAASTAGAGAAAASEAELAELLGVTNSDASYEQKAGSVGAGEAQVSGLAAGAGTGTGTAATASLGAAAATSGTADGLVLPNNAINLQMIHILQSQRDNYKDRLTRMETSMQKLQRESESAQAAKEQLEADNLALYSKIRYLQSYGASNNNRYTPPRRMGGGGGGGGGFEEGRVNDEDYLWDRVSNTPAALSSGMRGAGADVENRYHTLYEQRMNPFEQFSQHEKQRKLQELSVADRIVLNTTMAVISTHAGRTALLVYMGMMHLLVFCIIYYSTHHVHHGCDPTLDMADHSHHYLETAVTSAAADHHLASAASGGAEGAVSEQYTHSGGLPQFHF